MYDHYAALTMLPKSSHMFLFCVWQSMLQRLCIRVGTCSFWLEVSLHAQETQNDLMEYLQVTVQSLSMLAGHLYQDRSILNQSTEICNLATMYKLAKTN